MRVLHVAPSYFPAHQFGGPIQSVQLMNKYLVKNGIEIDVATTNAGLDPKNYHSKYWHQIDNVRVKYFNFQGYIHYNFSLALFFFLIRNIKKYDLVHITAVWNFPVFAAFLACKLMKKKYIISPRGTIYKETIELKSSKFKKIYYNLIAKRCLQNASFIHYTSLDEAEKVSSFLKLKSPYKIIPNGIEILYSKKFSKNENHEPYFLFLGRISLKKGLDILIEAFAKFKLINRTHKLYIVGPDEEKYKSTLEVLIHNLGIKGEIVFIDLVKGEEKNKIYQNAEAFVLTSYSENFGMTVVEAMQNDCPIIISDKVGIQDTILQYEAGIVCNLNIESICESFVKIIADPQYRTKITENGRKCIREEFDIDSVAKKFVLVYNDILK